MDTRTFIAALPLFEGLTPDQIEAVVRITVDVERPRGTLIFSEGDRAEGFYVAASGKVKIYKSAPDGREQIIHIYGPGEPFAEVPVFEDGDYPVNAMTLEKSRLLFFPRGRLRSLVERDATLAMNMLAAMARKLRRFTVRLENLTLRESPQRLAAYLLDASQRLGGTDEIELDISKGHLAGLLGTAQETLSRILSRMAGAGLISVNGRRISLLDPGGLEALASGEEKL